ncbi:hypothetical protein BC940DRAFT_234890 [Gongronella butleri]|nr:hypothetical protein BC940DRAFT_234890 [Gongronella butleri]
MPVLIPFIASEMLAEQIDMIKQGNHKQLKTMVDLGSQFYVQANVPDTTFIFVQVGFGFHVQFTLDEAKNYIGKKVQRLQSTFDCFFLDFFFFVHQIAIMVSSLASRPLDLVFYVFFLTHIPITVLFDLQALYPAAWVPQPLLSIVAWYAEATGDPFMHPLNNQYWFKSLASMEAMLQLPFFFVACNGLAKDAPWIRLPMVVYGAHVVTTLMPIMLELIANAAYNLTSTQRTMLLAIYSPYLIIPALILYDGYSRVTAALALVPVSKKKD